MIFKNAKDTPLNQQQGTVPQMGGALLDWFQTMVFGVVTKTTTNFQVIEDMEEITFKGVIQPFTSRQLLLKPEGQRAWSWFMVHSDPSLQLNVDMVIKYLGKQYRVMQKMDYSLYEYIQYDIIEDFTGAGPQVVTP
jgi:hypothetical protein